ncbi:hypothetical protein BKA64DRAFT_716515 [Cadophora sp. MPI-SDFR-AT-0126]|nr:hypothetical protein BKA64DRAFT_716515 [Leotiomycetes sp. MPI-SDFR-AT-0126]
MFRVRDSKGWSINKVDAEDNWFLDGSIVENQDPGHEIDEDEEDWCIFDFGRAKFYSDCSAKAWDRRCRTDREALENMFKVSRVKLAIAFLTQRFVNKDSIGIGSSTVSQPLNREALVPILHIMKTLAQAARDLITTILEPDLDSPPSIKLASIIIEIFCNAGSSYKAYSMIDKWLSCVLNTSRSTSGSSSNFDDTNHLPKYDRYYITFLYLLKAKWLRRYLYSATPLIETLHAALDVMLGDDNNGADLALSAADTRVLRVRRELSFQLCDVEKIGEAWELFDDCVTGLSEGGYEVGKGGGDGENYESEDMTDSETEYGRNPREMTIILEEWKHELIRQERVLEEWRAASEERRLRDRDGGEEAAC